MESPRTKHEVGHYYCWLLRPPASGSFVSSKSPDLPPPTTHHQSVMVHVSQQVPLYEPCQHQERRSSLLLCAPCSYPSANGFGLSADTSRDVVGKLGEPLLWLQSNLQLNSSHPSERKSKHQEDKTNLRPAYLSAEGRRVATSHTRAWQTTASQINRTDGARSSGMV